MSDDRLELPLFEAPEPDPREELDELFGEPPSKLPDSAQPVTDEPVVVEPIELPVPAEAAEAPTASTAPTAAAAAAAATAVAPPPRPEPAGVGSRLAAGLIDGVVHVALAALLIGGSSLLGAPVGWRHALPLAFVAGLFSFVYYVVPLAFWGRTPGMALAGLRVRTLDDEPLSLPQATQHWLALLLTVATGGLGVLLALGGRSLADRLSGSQTLHD